MSKEEANIEHFESVLENVGTGLPLFIGGCAAGSLIATRVASSNLGIYSGLINVGYQFRSTKDVKEKKKISKNNTQFYFQNIEIPFFLAQGAWDPFGKEEEIEAVKQYLPENQTIYYVEDGNHFLTPPWGSKQEKWLNTVNEMVKFIKKNIPKMERIVKKVVQRKLASKQEIVANDENEDLNGKRKVKDRIDAVKSSPSKRIKSIIETD